MKNSLRIFPLYIVLGLMLYASGCNRTMRKDELVSPDASISTEPVLGLTEGLVSDVEFSLQVPNPTEGHAVSEASEMTFYEYSEYCLSILNGEPIAAVEPLTLAEACTVYFRFYGGEVSVFEDARLENKQWQTSGPIKVLSKEAFMVSDAEMDEESRRYYIFYYDPDAAPDLEIIYRGFLGENWALITGDWTGPYDLSVYLAVDSDWSEGVFSPITEDDMAMRKYGGGRCGDAYFVSCHYDLADEAMILRSDDCGKTWKKLELPIPDAEFPTMYTPLSPVFNGESGILPVIVGTDNAFTSVLYFITEDGGMTWAYYSSMNGRPSET